MAAQLAKTPTAGLERQLAARRIVNEAKCLPVSPPIAFQILNLVREPEYSCEKLVRLVQLDPELTAQLLRLVNSVQLRTHRVSSVDEAIVRLGAEQVTQAALSLTLGRLVGIRQTAYCPDPAALWRHCVRCALASRYLRDVCSGVHFDSGLVFTAGLLHDIGKIVINNSPPEAVGIIAEVMHDEQINAADAELAVLGTDHAEMGGLLLDLWNLPPHLTNAVLFHHAPEFGDTNLATLIHVGNCCANVHAGSRGWQDFEKTLQPHALERLGLSRWDVEDCWGEILQSMDDIDRFVA